MEKRYLFQRRSKKSSKKYWYILTKQGNKTKWESTKTTIKSEAMEIYNKNKGKDDQIQEITISEFIEEISKPNKTNLRKSTLSTYIAAINELRKMYGDINLSEITNTMLEDFKTAKSKAEPSDKEGWGKTSLNINLRALSSCFGKAVKWHYLEQNPMKGVEIPKPIESKPRFFKNSAELNEFLAVVDDKVLRNMYEFCAYSGLRLGEACQAKWHWVNDGGSWEKGGFIRVKITEKWNTKSGKERDIPIAKAVIRVLNEQKKLQYKDATPIFQRRYKEKMKWFPLKKDYVTKKFTYYRKIAKLPKEYTFHVLRHTFISWCAMKNVPLLTIASYVGHSGTQLISKIYAHISAEHQLDEIKKLDNI